MRLFHGVVSEADTRIQALYRDVYRRRKELPKSGRQHRTTKTVTCSNTPCCLISSAVQNPQNYLSSFDAARVGQLKFS
jgi:hypothetical protein